MKVLSCKNNLCNNPDFEKVQSELDKFLNKKFLVAFGLATIQIR